MLGIGLTKIIPLFLYIIGLGAIIITLTKYKEYAIYYIAFMMPFRNIQLRLHEYPLGKDIFDYIILILLIRILFIKDVERSKTQQWILGFIILCIISFIYGISYLGYFSDFGMQDLKNYVLMMLLYFLAFYYIDSLQKIRLIFIIFCVATFYMNYQVWSYFSSRSVGAFSYGIRYSGPFVYLGPNHLGAFFIHFFPILFTIGLNESKKIVKYSIIGLSFFSIYSILYSFSRGAYLALVVVLLIHSFFKNRKLMVVIIVFLFVWQFIIPEAVIQRIEMTQGEDGEIESSAASRIILWDHALNLFEQNPIFGIGFRNFQYTTEAEIFHGLRDPHNYFLTVLSESGIIGIAYFLFLLFLAFRSGYSCYSTSKNEFHRNLSFGFILCIIAVITTNFFGDRWSYMMVNGYFWIFWGIVDRIPYLQENDRINNSLETSG